MSLRLLQSSLALILALGLASGVHAQSQPGAAGAQDDAAMVPVWNDASGEIEAVLVLEPTGETTAGARWDFGSQSLTAAFGLESGDSLGLLCNRKSGITGTIGSLAGCQVALSGPDASGDRRTTFSLSLGNPDGRVGIAAGSGRSTLPGWLTPNTGTARIKRNDLTVFAEKNIGSTGVVSIGGTLARARLVPAGQMPNLVHQWNTKSLSIGGGIGNFRANIVGRVVDVPGQPEQWQGLGVGLTWRTPWSGKLTIGAENIVTRGRNPFSPTNAAGDEEGTVPYVRYQQDL